jgi:hypothetical protein
MIDYHVLPEIESTIRDMAERLKQPVWNESDVYVNDMLNLFSESLIKKFELMAKQNEVVK